MISAQLLGRLGLASVLSLSLAACTSADPAAGQASAAATVSSAATSSPAVAATPAATRAVLKRVGVSLPLNRLAGFIKTTGSVPNQLSIYQQWSAKAPFDAVAATAAKARGMKILVTWEPWAPKCNCAKQPAWSDRKITSGVYDSYIRAYARSVKAFTATGGHVTVRLAHEMNGNWYPWAAGANGNTAASYVAMWRHVYRVFATQHAPNVRWMWSPNLSYTGSKSIRSLYPGAAYVNDVGLSGYNFGGGAGFTWTTFAKLFQPSLTALRKLVPSKPLYLAEIGCAPQGGNKAAWIVDMFRQIKKRPYIAGVTWFEQRTQRNWLVEDSAADVKAWKTGVALLQRS